MKNLERIKSVRQKLDVLQMKVMDVENMEIVTSATRGRQVIKDMIAELKSISVNLNDRRKMILERRT
jgi:hypothetical protein